MTTAETDALIRSRLLQLDGLEILSRAKGGDGRTVVAYAAVYNERTEIRDSDGHYFEQISPNAFEWDTLPGVFYHHGRTLYGTPSELGSVPIGRPVEISSDSRGLLTVSRFNDSDLADSVLSSIRNGDPMGMSFTGEFSESDPPTGPWFDTGAAGDLTTVTRKRIGLREYGPTPYGPASTPAYAGAEIIGVRAQDQLPDREQRDGQREQIAVSDATAQTLAGLRYVAQNYPITTSTTATTGTSTNASTTALTFVAAEQTQQGGAEQAPDGPETQSGASAERAAVIEQAPATGDAETKGKKMADSDRAPMTVEERVARQSEIRARLAEIDVEYSGAELPDQARAEWQNLQTEMVEHERAVADSNARADYLRFINSERPDATEGVGTRAGYAPPATSPGVPMNLGRTGPALHTRDNIFDLAAIRNRARHIDEVPVLYREYAMRAVEGARFPGAAGAETTREQAQERVAHLLDTIDDEKGTLARRILTTGSPTYDRAFGKMMATQSTHGLTAEESRALALGTDSAGGFAVPFQLDPTVILTSNGAINPLRQIARVETITGKEWDGVTTAGVTVSRVSEGTEAGTGDPAFAQPTVRTTRVQGFVPFSIELDVSWGALRSQITSILMDAKDVEEGAGTSGFVLGNGTAPNAGGVVTTLGTTQYVNTATTATLALADIYNLENSMAPRFRQQSSYLASKTVYNKLKTLAQAVTALGGDPWVKLGAGVPGALNGYPAYEASAMSGSVTTSNQLVLLQGDFSKFLIVDRVGMGIELVPHLFGATNRYPTGQRGILAIWFNNSAILVPNAFRMLKIL